MPGGSWTLIAERVERRHFMDLSTNMAGGVGAPDAGLMVEANRRVRSAEEESRSSFASLMARGENEKGTQTRELVYKRMEELVSAVLVGPVMKSLRSTNTAAEPFKPTSAEKQFQGLMDAKVALEITRRSRMPVVEQATESVMRRLERMKAGTEGAAGAVDVKG